jgi:hypothetical protein
MTPERLHEIRLRLEDWIYMEAFATICDATSELLNEVDRLNANVIDLNEYIRVSGEEHDEEIAALEEKECPVCHFKPGEIDAERRERDWE